MFIRHFGGKLLRSEQAQGLAEYAVMLGLLLAMLFLVRAIGYDANLLFQLVANSFH